jgi:hypothetical protein
MGRVRVGVKKAILPVTRLLTPIPAFPRQGGRSIYQARSDITPQAHWRAAFWRVRVERRVNPLIPFGERQRRGTTGKQGPSYAVASIPLKRWLQFLVAPWKARLMVQLPLLNDQAINVLKMAISYHKR